MLPALLMAVFLSLQMAAGNPLLTSPLFGYSLGGDPFDDGTAAVIPPVARLHSIHVCHGDLIDGIQLVYILEDNGTFIGPPHGKMNENCSNLKDSVMSKIVFKENERLVHVEGVVYTDSRYPYVSQLKLFTSVSGQSPIFRGGPFGRVPGVPLSLTGDVRGIFGRRGDVLDAIGFYIDPSLPLNFYNKTVVGGEGGNDFDDFKNLSSRNEKPLKITNMVINHNKMINGIQVTYMVCSGASISITHGTIAVDSLSFLDFEADEWITKVNTTTSYLGSQSIYVLGIETTNSKGSVRSYGPFGTQPYNGTMTTVHGTVHGLYGRDYGNMVALGFYV